MLEGRKKTRKLFFFFFFFFFSTSFFNHHFFRFRGPRELALVRRQRAFGSGKRREQVATTNGARREKNSLAFRRVVVLNREGERERNKEEREPE